LKIKTQFIVCIAIFSVILIVIAASVAVTDQGVRQLSSQAQVSSKIERSASSLNSVAIDYFLYQEELQLSRWQMIHASMHNELSEIDPNNSQQQGLVTAIDEDLHGLNESFVEVISFLEDAPRNVSVRIDPKFQFMWSDLALRSENLASDASRLSDQINDQSRQMHSTNTLLIVSLVATSGALIAAVFLIAFQKTLKSIAELQDGIKKIGSGDLNYVVETQRNDEVGELSHSFNEMTAKLRTVTASKADLEKEIAERIKAEETIRHRNEELERLQFKLEEKAAEVEEYANQMEELAKERAKKLQDAERLATIGATAGMVGHDIRNPLQAIIGDLYFAKKDLAKMPEIPLKSNIKESLTSIEASVSYINKIVQDLQDYATPITLTLQEANLQAICEETLFSLNVPNNVSASCQVDEDAKLLMTDSLVLKRILNNLTSNAVQAMPQGGKLTFRAYKDSEGIVVTLEDTGVGISKEAEAKLFTPMFTTKAKGQGFGLVVVKRMTEALGGTVRYESELGKGTKFIVHLPDLRKSSNR
jgi:signal transduction histidine kinase